MLENRNFATEKKLSKNGPRKGKYEKEQKTGTRCP